MKNSFFPIEQISRQKLEGSVLIIVENLLVPFDC